MRTWSRPIALTQRELVRFQQQRFRREWDCLVWTGTRNRRNYGIFWADKRFIGVHRIVWQLAHPNEDLVGWYICHRCDNPPCARLEHLFRGTAADNTRDMVEKGRHFPAKYPGNEGSWRASLSDDDICDIRASTELQEVIATRYKLSPHYVWKIRTRRVCAEVEDRWWD